MAYATIGDVQGRMARQMSDAEQSVCANLLDDAAVIIDAYNSTADTLGYSQSWTIGSGSAGELYLSKLEKKLLGCGNSIGSYSPTEALVPTEGSL